VNEGALVLLPKLNETGAAVLLAWLEVVLRSGLVSISIPLPLFGGVLGRWGVTPNEIGLEVLLNKPERFEAEPVLGVEDAGAPIEKGVLSVLEGA
jgi:hypothetical protein